MGQLLRPRRTSVRQAATAPGSLYPSFLPLGGLTGLIGTIALGDPDNRSEDILGRAFESVLGQFASAEGEKGGQSSTPWCVVRVVVEMLAPCKGARL